MAGWSGAVHALSLQARRARDRAPFPASPHQTGHAVFPHPAFRDRSSGRCRRCPVPGHGSTQAIQPELLEERPVMALPVPAGPMGLLAEKQRHAFADVVVHLGEVPTGVAHPEVSAPAPQQAVQFGHERLDWFPQPRPGRGDRFDAVPHPLHRSPSGPLMQVLPAAPAPGFHLATVKP